MVVNAGDLAAGAANVIAFAAIYLIADALRGGNLPCHRAVAVPELAVVPASHGKGFEIAVAIVIGAPDIACRAACVYQYASKLSLGILNDHKIAAARRMGGRGALLPVACNAVDICVIDAQRAKDIRRYGDAVGRYNIVVDALGAGIDMPAVLQRICSLYQCRV